MITAMKVWVAFQNDRRTEFGTKVLSDKGTVQASV